jgi:hypothetical protein
MLPNGMPPLLALLSIESVSIMHYIFVVISILSPKVCTQFIYTLIYSLKNLTYIYSLKNLNIKSAKNLKFVNLYYKTHEPRSHHSLAAKIYFEMRAPY